jgi:hypothetical protein
MRTLCAPLHEVQESTFSCKNANMQRHEVGFEVFRFLYDQLGCNLLFPFRELAVRYCCRRLAWRQFD